MSEMKIKIEKHTKSKNLEVQQLLISQNKPIWILLIVFYFCFINCKIAYF